MQTSYGFSGLLCFSKTNTNSHSHCRQSFRATRTSSWTLTGIVKCFKAHPMPTQTTKACQNMPPPQCSCLSMHKTARESLRANKRSPTFHRNPHRQSPDTSSDGTLGITLFKGNSNRKPRIKKKRRVLKAVLGATLFQSFFLCLQNALRSLAVLTRDR